MIHIIHISDGHKHFGEAIKEYEKRLGKQILIHTIKPIKHTESTFIKNKETEKILEKLAKIPGKIFLCDERGEHMNTKNFSNCIQKLYNKSENIIFVIGGSYGFDVEKIQEKYCVQLLKFSDMIFPHSLAFLILMEQIYRSFEIMK
jgi:ribosomal RNA large subunit methyltransferase H